MTWSRQQRHKQRAERLGRESLDRCDRFAADIERAASLLRHGTLDDLADFASRNAEARAIASDQRARKQCTDRPDRCEGCDKSCVSCKPPRGHCARCLGEVRSQGLVADGVLLHRCCAPKKKAA